VFAVVPQALPMVASYSLLLFESNVRHATILGIVGAGGVGFVLSKYMALFQYQYLMGALVLIVLPVTVIDRLSDMLRRRLI
jgi:phosphonate transport system permease protein